ncbi:ABC transporter permease [Janibacter alkaliphilus]|uniref:Oligopeptide transport system permease protein n=1 Tax=Janibacter alkaliphilus TaxID=1069963 RepID=A0A852X331_9MICO|nr:oligopeptide transport system permease protein [Janibacter alkaliphilus]
MGQYVLRRLLQMIPVIIGATFIIYAMVFALGDPSAGACGDKPCPPGVQAEFDEKYNSNDPLPVAYAKYLGGFVQGDLGESRYDRPVSEELTQRYPVTAKLGAMALVIEAVIGIAAGALAAVRKGGFLDNLVLVSTLVLISVPVFVTGALAQYFLGVKLALFPVTVPADPTMYDLLLPAIVLASLSMAYVARLTRTNLAENLRADYVRTAKAKGLTPGRTIGVHALRNSMIPVITFIGYDFGALLGGAIITERIFNIRGVGGYVFAGIGQRDAYAVVGAVTVLVIVYLIVNLIVDLLYGALDPRITHD